MCLLKSDSWWGGKKICMIFFLVIYLPSALAQVSLLKVDRSEFSPARKETVEYSVRAGDPGELGISVYTPDGDLVTQRSRLIGEAGDYVLTWDGLSDAGHPVPNEAYSVVAWLKSKNGLQLHDPRASSGGEIIGDVKPDVSPDGMIRYRLPVPARVMVRVGVRGGAMMRSLATWTPQPAGLNTIRWNGFDSDGLVDLRNDRLAVMLSAFRLPDFSVIVTGQDAISYRNWRLAQGWTEPAGASGPSAQPLDRNGVRIARQHYTPRYKDQEPRISISLVDQAGQLVPSGARVPDDARVTVDIVPEDRWLMQESLYEVAFFVDGEFVSEEENGYVPISWLWRTSALKPGPHLFTVNVTGFTGKVGAKSIRVIR